MCWFFLSGIAIETRLSFHQMSTWFGHVFQDQTPSTWGDVPDWNANSWQAMWTGQQSQRTVHPYKQGVCVCNTFKGQTQSCACFEVNPETKSVAKQSVFETLMGSSRTSTTPVDAAGAQAVLGRRALP